MPRIADSDDHGDQTQRGTGADAEHLGTGERIAGHPLHQRAGHREHCARRKRRDRAWRAPDGNTRELVEAAEMPALRTVPDIQRQCERDDRQQRNANEAPS